MYSKYYCFLTSTFLLSPWSYKAAEAASSLIFILVEVKKEDEPSGKKSQNFDCRDTIRNQEGKIRNKCWRNMKETDFTFYFLNAKLLQELLKCLAFTILVKRMLILLLFSINSNDSLSLKHFRKNYFARKIFKNVFYISNCSFLYDY